MPDATTDNPRPYTDRAATPVPPIVPPALAGRTAAAIIRGLDTLKAAQNLVWDMDQVDGAATVLSDDAVDVDAAHQAMWEASGTSDLRNLVAAIASVTTEPTGLGGAVPDHEQVKQLRARYEHHAARWADVVASQDGATTSGASAAAKGAPLRDDQELERTVHELRADLEHLRRELATEVRTRRLVVIEEDGFERVVAEAAGSYGAVQVYARDTGSGTYVALEAGEGDLQRAMVYLSGGGNGHGTFQVLGTEGGGHEASLDVLCGVDGDSVACLDRRGLTVRDSTTSSRLAADDRIMKTSADVTYDAMLGAVVAKCGAELAHRLDEVVQVRLGEMQDRVSGLLVSTEEELAVTQSELRGAHSALKVIAGAATVAVDEIYVDEAHS